MAIYIVTNDSALIKCLKYLIIVVTKEKIKSYHEKKFTFSVLFVKRKNQNQQWVYCRKASKYGNFCTTSHSLSYPNKRMLFSMTGSFLFLSG